MMVTSILKVMTLNIIIHMYIKIHKGITIGLDMMNQLIPNIQINHVTDIKYT